MSIARSSIGWFTANVISSVVAFFALIYFSRELGPKVLGVYFLFNSILNVLKLFGNVGLQAATTKRISEGVDASEFFTASLIIRLVPFLILSIGVFLARSFLNSFMGAELSIFLIILLGFLQFSDLMRETLQGEKKVATSAFVDLAQVIGKVSVQVVLVVLGAGIYGLIVGLNVGFMVSIAFGIFLIDVRLCRPRREHYLSILDFSRYSFGNAIGGYLYEWADIVVIGLFLTQEFVGVYGVCWIISGVFLLSSQAVASSIFPRISELSGRGELDEIRGIFSEGLVFSSFLVIPAMVGTLILSSDLLGIVYGEDFRVGYLVLIILMLGRVFQSFQMISVRVMEGMDRPDVVFRINIVTTVLNIVGTLVLVYWIGFEGAAVATSLTIGVSFLWNTYYVLTFLDARLPYREFSFELVSAGLMGIFVWLLWNAALFSPVFNLVLSIITGAMLYFLVILGISRNMRLKIFTLLSIAGKV
ncbi:MAG: oligosaccharide flippase family protein [Thermodesulfobacteriota bacterium]